MKNNLKEKNKDSTIDELDAITFKPIRRNYIYELPETLNTYIDERLWKFQFDKTFEIQVRTIFAEGWHEVEHDLRYKNQECWEDSTDLSRHLNGILATLETCDWSLSKVFNELAYHNYKNFEWVHMIKNKLRIRMINDKPSSEIECIIKENKNDILKKLFTCDRTKLLDFFSKSKLPINIDNIVYVANSLYISNANISNLTPKNYQRKTLGI